MIKIAVSSGDPSGIGPDICIKAFSNFHSMNCCPIIFGNINLFKERAEMLKTRVEIEEYKGEEVSLLKRDKLWIVNSDIDTTINRHHKITRKQHLNINQTIFIIILI